MAFSLSPPTYGRHEKFYSFTWRSSPDCGKFPCSMAAPDAGADEFDLQAQPAPDYEFDQRIAW
jgi:hypothetical protein